MDFGKKLVMIGIVLLEHADIPLATGNIHTLAGGVVIQIVGILNRCGGHSDGCRNWLRRYEFQIPHTLVYRDHEHCGGWRYVHDCSVRKRFSYLQGRSEILRNRL
jgi:hypothetical protein